MNFKEDKNLIKILNGSDVADIDRKCIESGIDSKWLMNNAGKSISDFIIDFYSFRVKNAKDLYEKKLKCCLICGTGNNGGDGFVCAANLAETGIDVTIFYAGQKDRLRNDSLFYYEKLIDLKNSSNKGKDFLSKNINIRFIDEKNNISYLKELERYIKQSDFVVDALFGTGLHKDPIRGISIDIIRIVNNIKKDNKNLKVFSIDIPSGIDSDDGKVLGDAIKADYTITFGTKKTGHILYPGSTYSGKVKVVDIGIPERIINDYDALFEASLEWVAKKIPQRGAYSYKHSVGKLLVIAGSKGFTGAAVMTCEAAMRAGAGIVTLVCPVELNQIFEIKLTEVMTYPTAQTDTGSLHLNAFKDILAESNRYDAMAIGPGLSRNPSTVMLVREILKNIRMPIVLDADGLRALASPMGIEDDGLFNLDNVIITPHQGELCSILLKEKINPEERINVNKETSEKFGVVSLLKGSSTLITLGKNTFVNPTGDFSLATAGTGDILTGIIGSFLCQGMDRLSAAVCGAYIHGLAAELISFITGKTSMIATDLLEGLKKVFLEIEKLKY